MDINSARWILEFLIRQPIENRVINSILQVIPLSNDDLRWKKTILLRRILSEISNGSVSERILEFLDMIEEIDYREGTAVLESMKAAYCAVAVDCTVKLLRDNSDKDTYFDAVKRIWRGRILDVERTKDVGLVSEQLKHWREEMEAALCDRNVRESVLKKGSSNDALKLVRACIAEMWENMGPSFLELAARTMDEKASKLLDSDNILRGDDDVGEGKAAAPDGCQYLVLKNRVASGDDRSDMDIDSSAQNIEEQMRRSSAIGMQNSTLILADKLVPIQERCSTDVGITGISKRAVIPQSSEVATRASCMKYDCLQTPEVDKVRKALKLSSMELRASVKDPLPDALQMAETVLSDMDREKMDHGSSERNQKRVDVDAPNASVGEDVEAIQANRNNSGSKFSRNCNNMHRPSLMTRNSTAQTFEWNDDSIEASSEGSPNCSKKIHLPSPQRRIVSPLKKYEITKFTRRRQIRKWSTLEEETLRTAVKKYGKGNWKLILNCYREVFEERTEVDLKDKWRNMLRS